MILKYQYDYGKRTNINIKGLIYQSVETQNLPFMNICSQVESIFTTKTVPASLSKFYVHGSIAPPQH